jgi:eukaryotic-like serine/threonine-protein kinase
MKQRLLLISLGCLLLAVFSSCGSNTSTNQAHEVVLSNCQGHPPSISVTANLPAPDAHFIYVGSGGNLYALNAANGAMLWCKQVKITGNFPCPHSCPPPPFMLFGQPTVVDGVVYVCASGYQGYTYAFRARDGSLLWRVESNCAVDSIPFADYAVPLVDHGIVYTGSYALRAQDGKILWSTSLGVSFQSLVGGVLYANTEDTIYALNANNGSVRWHYEAPDRAPVGGRLVISGNRVYFGTLASEDQWEFSMGSYSGATLLNDLVYVSSRDQYLYALQVSNGTTRWRFKSVYPVYNTAAGANDVLYINMDGPYALNAETGKVIWHQTLGSSPSVGFTPSTVIGNVLYLASTDGQGNSTLYALNANTGAIYWHSSSIRQVMPLTVV